VDISTIDAGSLAFRFDSSWRPECCDDGEDATNNQTAIITAEYTVGGSIVQVQVLRWESTQFLPDEVTPNPLFHPDAENESVLLTSSQLQVPAGATAVRFKFALVNAGNDWWWAMDNLALDASHSGKAGTIWSEDFEGLTLGASPEEAGNAGCSPYCGRNTYTHTGPNGVVVDSSMTAAGGVPDWRGWSFVDRIYWNDLGGDDRGAFTNGSGLIAVADGDEWSDLPTDPAGGTMITFMDSPAFNIAQRCGDTLILSFDNSWNPEPNQAATITVSFNGGAPVQLAHWSSVDGDPDFRAANLNERVNLPIAVPAGATTARLSFQYIGQNNWWWAVDNITVFEGVVEVPANRGVVRRDRMALAPNVNFQPCFTPWSPTPPAGWSVDNSQMSSGGRPEWQGWNFGHREWWSTNVDTQRRAEFTLGDSYIAIADADEWDDFPSDSPHLFNSFLNTPVIPLAATGNVSLEFDSSWRDECCDDGDGTNNQTATIVATYTVGASHVDVEVMRWDSDSSSPTFKNDAPNEHVVINTAGLQIPVGATAVSFSIGLTNAANDWWWAVDDVTLFVNDGVVFSESFDGVPNTQAPPTENVPTTRCIYFSTVDEQVNGYTSDNSELVCGGSALADFTGWNAWVSEAWARNQGGLRTQFHAVESYVSDFTAAQSCTGRASLVSPSFDVRAFNADSLSVTFRSGWLSAPSHISNVQVSYDGGPWTSALTWNANVPTGNPAYKLTNTDETVSVSLHNPAGAQSARIRFVDAASGWWAVSNIIVTGLVGDAGCRGDWNRDCTLNSQDFFDFITAFFANSADFNNDNLTNSQDFFDFIVAFFAGC